MTTTDTPRTDAELMREVKIVKLTKQNYHGLSKSKSSWYNTMKKIRQIYEEGETPLTDAARERYYDGKTSDWVHYTICRMIEQELAASKAEVARLKKELDAWDYGTRAKREQEARKKAEAEVERLREWVRSEWPEDQAEEIINNCKSK